MLRTILVISLFTLISSTLPAQTDQDPSTTFSIYFGGGSYYIDQRQTIRLHQWLQQYPDLDGYQLVIHSYTDDIGPLEYNERLSQMRSQATVRKLIQLGIDPEGISIEDFGEENPVFDNATMEGKLRNRRVDIIIKRIFS
jgi:outer membrane protein OmpA-like peptidoglycan-associated protein